MKGDLWLLLHAKWVLDWTSDLGDFCNNHPAKDINISNMEEISFKVILRGKELDKAEEYLYSIKNAIKEDIVEQNCEFEDFDVVITE